MAAEIEGVVVLRIPISEVEDAVGARVAIEDEPVGSAFAKHPVIATASIREIEVKSAMQKIVAKDGRGNGRRIVSPERVALVRPLALLMGSLSHTRNVNTSHIPAR
jgi:hypothetical protein